MNSRRVVAGTTGALLAWWGPEPLAGLSAGDDVVLVPTAAAFTGATEATVRLAERLEPTGARLEALMVLDRASADEPYFARRVAEADWVVLLDGSALHARTAWRSTAVAEALARCRGIVAIGATATVLGEHMVDPRGGAPTTGLGLWDDVTVTTAAGAEQLARTRRLLGDASTLIVIDQNGAVGDLGSGWRQLSDGGVEASCGDTIVALGRP